MEHKRVTNEEIHNLFGPAVATDLQMRKVVPERTITGGFLLQRGQEFFPQEYTELFRRKPKVNHLQAIRDKRAILEQQVLKCRPEAYDLDDEDNFELFVNFRHTLDMSFEDAAHSSDVEMSELPDVVMMEEKSSMIKDKHFNIKRKIPRYINRCNYENFESNLFTSNSRTIEKFCEFMGPHRKEYELCLPLIEPIYGKFLIKHKKFRYEYISKKIPQDKSSMKGQISRRQLYEFFRKIFLVVVPVELFGNRRNVRKIRKMVNKYLGTGFGEYFSPKAVVNQLNISSVEWLRVIENEKTKISIMSQLMESFFTKYIMAVLGTYFYTEKMTSNNEKVFFRLNYWKHHLERYIKQLIASKVYKRVVKKKKHVKFVRTDIPDAKLIPHLKKNGMRPIVMIKPTPTQRKEASILNRLLYQLFLKKFEILKLNKVENLWRSIHNSCSGKAERPLYFVTCDINNAFGSINLQKLLQIIFAMVDELDENLDLRKFTIFNRKFNRAYIQRDYFDTPSLPLALPTGSLACRDTSKPGIIIDRDWLKYRLRDYILYRRITIDYKFYNQLRGVAQGVPLSAMLCQIYYGTMLKEEFGSFTESGHLLRFVDDFLYLTQDRTSAERFLEKIHKGIRSYNCFFNRKKTSTNLPPYCADEFTYLGYRFNINNFNVTPQYSDISVRYMTKLHRHDPGHALQMFANRLANVQFLKMNRIVFDQSINSKEVIEKTIHQIATMSAKRCFALLLSMFDLENIPITDVFRIIRSKSVNAICNKILSTHRPKTSSSTQDRELYKRFLKKYVWRIFLKNFQGRVPSLKPLVQLMKICSG